MDGFGPRIPVRDLPSAEWDAAEFVEHHLYHLGQRCEELAADVALFDFSRAEMTGSRSRENSQHRRLMQDWTFIAARDAASSLYRFEEDMEQLGANLNACPSLLAMIDSVAKRKATRAFAKSFPGFDALRHSSQHPAKIYATASDLRKHAPATVKVINSLVGARYETDFNGNRVGLDLTQGTVAKLQAVKELYWAVFWPLDPQGQAKHAAALKRAKPPGQA